MSVQVQEASVWKRVADLPSKFTLKTVSEVNYTIEDTDDYDLYFVDVRDPSRARTISAVPARRVRGTITYVTDATGGGIARGCFMARLGGHG